MDFRRKAQSYSQYSMDNISHFRAVILEAQQNVFANSSFAQFLQFEFVQSLDDPAIATPLRLMTKLCVDSPSSHAGTPHYVMLCCQYA